MWLFRRQREIVVSLLCLIRPGCLRAGSAEMVVHDKSGNVEPLGLIHKTAFSDRLRVIFFAGVEGTGHHFFTTAFENFYRVHSELVAPTLCACETSMFLPTSMNRSVSVYANARREIRAEMLMVARVEKELEHPGTIVTVQKTTPEQLALCPAHARLSYPAGYGPNKALLVPDLVMLAEIAESEGVDLRIVYLQRSARDILLSTTRHRHMQNHLEGLHQKDSFVSGEDRFMAYVQILLLDAAALHSSLAELGPGFVVCHRFGEMASHEQAEEISNFVSPTEPIRGYIRSMLLDNAREPRAFDNDVMRGEVSYVVDRLQRKLDVIEAQFCGGRGEQ